MAKKRGVIVHRLLFDVKHNIIHVYMYLLCIRNLSIMHVVTVYLLIIY